MKLIIAEKPSQAKLYANALHDSFKEKKGYLESENTYITWCFGHLISLEQDTAYREGKSWNKSYLPLIPLKFKYCIGKDKEGKEDKGKKRQLDIIKYLMSKSESIINATDADREGELIFLYIYNYLECKLPFKRLWISSLTEEEIRKGFKNLKSREEFDNLGKSGYARAITDWLVGINATQSATLQLGSRNPLTIGRVQTTILKIICERWLKNQNHKSSFKYRLVSKHEEQNQKFTSSSNIFETKEEAERNLSKLKEYHTFLKKKREEIIINPPLLHSIDTLIIEANKKFKYSGKETLSIAQKLYEKKLISYPRTDSQYINEEGYSQLKKILPQFSQDYLGKSFSFQILTPKSVNEKKITGSHDAIVPTGYKLGIKNLNDKELNVFLLIISKCLESFSEAALVEKNTYVFENNSVEFFTNCSHTNSIGWMKFSYEQNKKKEHNEEELKLSFNPGEQIYADSSVYEIKSTPPSLYTDATLTKALTKIGKFLKDEDPKILEELKGKIDLSDIQIGTQATRPIIIDKLINIGFVIKEKNKFIPTDKGFKFYETIKNLKVTNVAYTAILEKELKDIAEGTISEEKYYTRLYSYVKKIVSDIFSIQIELKLNEKNSIGICPKCKKGNIIEKDKSLGCDRYNKDGCDFIFAKTIAKKKLTEKNIKDILEKGETQLIKGFMSKANKPFDAFIKLDADFKTIFSYKK